MSKKAGSSVSSSLVPTATPPVRRACRSKHQLALILLCMYFKPEFTTDAGMDTCRQGPAGRCLLLGTAMSPFPCSVQAQRMRFWTAPLRS